MANQSTIRPDTLKIPRGYPDEPAPGKIVSIFDANRKDLYHRLSPYGTDTFLGIKSRQPFIYKYPDEKVGTMASLASREFAFSRAATDVVRVTKFMISGQGILWLGKQFLLQTGNPFNETRLYNPTSPIVAAAGALTFGMTRPTRHIDLSSVGSIVSSFLGTNIGSIFSTRTTPPAGTVGFAGLATNNQDAGKGLLRAGTANKALGVLHSKWAGPSTGAGLGLGGFLSGTIKSLFGNFFPQRQSGVKKRADEGAYGLMLASYSGETGAFSYQGVNGLVNGVQQFWYAGSKSEMRQGIGVPLNWVKLYTGPDGRPIFQKPSTSNIAGLTGNVGYTVEDSGKPLRYGDHVGKTKNDDWEGSDVLIQQAMYVEESKKFPSKGTDKTDPSVIKMRESLQRVITSIEAGKTYKVEVNPESSLVFSNQEKTGYDRIAAMKRHGDTERQYKHSVLEEYRKRSIRVLESGNTDDPLQKSMKMATSGQFDGINSLQVVSGEKFRETSWEVWKPYRDDLIAFYFYDVVNDKYIPFRATVSGLQETDSANWEELSFLGRADRLYSYSGFNRSLTFMFTVNISSIVELAPTWQRINYLMSLVKPASYTQGQDANNLNARFMVPPMVMITIGDLYKNQPVVIGSAGLTVPDTALWETLNTDNSEEWSYLANYIKSPNVGKLYGQLPKTVSISVNCYILEKERAIVGAAHFGHAPHTEAYKKGEYRNTQPDFTNPSELHKYMVVYNEQKAAPKAPAMSP
jgi:hypothetical protein